MLVRDYVSYSLSSSDPSENVRKKAYNNTVPTLNPVLIVTITYILANCWVVILADKIKRLPKPMREKVVEKSNFDPSYQRDNATHHQKNHQLQENKSDDVEVLHP